VSLSKRILRSPLIITAFSHVLAGYIRLVYATSRKQRLVPAHIEPYFTGEKNCIFAFWHGRMMLIAPFRAKQRKTHILISFHRDGVLISQVIGHFGVGTISGSSSRGGDTAMREMISLLEAGEYVGITPDGPRGPNQQIAAKGVLTLARLSGKPIIPVTFSTSRCIRLGSWDRFMLALPFGRVAMLAGEPIMFSENSSEQHNSQALEQAMNALVAQADEAVRV